MNTNIQRQPKCGGPKILLQDDGRVHVDGLGIITRKWSENVDKWHSMISLAAAKWDIPESWIAGVMLQESGGTQGALSPAGAIGLMQIMSSTPKIVFGLNTTREELYQPETNIDIGARLLAKLARDQHWDPVHVAASYNAGGVYCYSGKNCATPGRWNVNENCGYCEQVIRGINAAIDAGYSGTGSNEVEGKIPSAVVGIACAFVAFAIPIGVLAYLGFVPVPKFARGLVRREA